MNDLYLKNGVIVTDSDEFRGGIVIKDGRIAALVEGVPAIESHREMDLAGKVVIPGIVDSHVHFEDPGKTEWEEFNTGGMAGAAGGVTTLMDMPVDSEPPTTNRANLQVKLEAINPKAIVDFALWGGLVDNNLNELDDLNADGVIGFKAFMEDTGIDTFKCVRDDVLYSGLLRSHDLQNLVAVHAENDYVVSFLAKKLQAEGRTDRQAWLDSRLPETELEAVKRAIFWAKLTHGNLHVVHATNAACVLAVDEAKASGVHVTVETGPNYLFFDEEDFLREGPLLKMGPPLRPRAEVEKLWNCVLDGKVDVIGSDHSPSTWALKEPGRNNVWKGWGGIGGIQTMLPVMLTEGVHQRGLKLTKLVKMMSANPAKIFGLYPQKGCLMPGSDADLVILDPDKKWTFHPEQLFNKNPESPYLNHTYHGCVEQTILRGKTIYANGKILVEPGYGQFLRRKNRYETL